MPLFMYCKAGCEPTPYTLNAPNFCCICGRSFNESKASVKPVEKTNDKPFTPVPVKVIGQKTIWRR